MTFAGNSDVKLKLVELCESVDVELCKDVDTELCEDVDVELCEDVEAGCDGWARPTKEWRLADNSGPSPPFHQALSITQGNPKASASASLQHKRKLPNVAITILRSLLPLILAGIALDDPP